MMVAILKTIVFFSNNGHIVSYNASLIYKYDCHINIKICAYVQVAIYIHKYTYKGYHRATLKLGEDHIQVNQYLDVHYIGASKAVRRLLTYPMHVENPIVI